MIDIVSDGASCPVRVRIDTGSHAILLAPGGKPLWNLDGDPVQIEWGLDLYLDYLSPAFSAATANRLGSTADIRGRVPRAGDLPAEEGEAVIRAPRGGGDRHAGRPVLGSSLALHAASHGVDPLAVGRRGTWWSPTRGYSNWRRTSRGRAGRSRARAGGERPEGCRNSVRPVTSGFQADP